MKLRLSLLLALALIASVAFVTAASAQQDVPDAEAFVLPDAIHAGGTVSVAAANCPPPEVAPLIDLGDELFGRALLRPLDAPWEFTTTAPVPANPDGTWSAPLEIVGSVPAGEHIVEAQCGVIGPDGVFAAEWVTELVLVVFADPDGPDMWVEVSPAGLTVHGSPCGSSEAAGPFEVELDLVGEVNEVAIIAEVVDGWSYEIGADRYEPDMAGVTRVNAFCQSADGSVFVEYPWVIVDLVPEPPGTPTPTPPVPPTPGVELWLDQLAVYPGETLSGMAIGCPDPDVPTPAGDHEVIVTAETDSSPLGVEWSESQVLAVDPSGSVAFEVVLPDDLTAGSVVVVTATCQVREFDQIFVLHDFPPQIVTVIEPGPVPVELRVDPPEAMPGETLFIEAAGCPDPSGPILGGAYQVLIDIEALGDSPWQETITASYGPDGLKYAEVSIPAELQPGSLIEVRARCMLEELGFTELLFEYPIQVVPVFGYGVSPSLIVGPPEAIPGELIEVIATGCPDPTVPALGGSYRVVVTVDEIDGPWAHTTALHTDPDGSTSTTVAVPTDLVPGTELVVAATCEIEELGFINIVHTYESVSLIVGEPAPYVPTLQADLSMVAPGSVLTATADWCAVAPGVDEQAWVSFQLDYLPTPDGSWQWQDRQLAPASQAGPVEAVFVIPADAAGAGLWELSAECVSGLMDGAFTTVFTYPSILLRATGSDAGSLWIQYGGPDEILAVASGCPNPSRDPADGEYSVVFQLEWPAEGPLVDPFVDEQRVPATPFEDAYAPFEVPGGVSGTFLLSAECQRTDAGNDLRHRYATVEFEVIDGLPTPTPTPTPTSTPVPPPSPEPGMPVPVTPTPTSTPAPPPSPEPGMPVPVTPTPTSTPTPPPSTPVVPTPTLVPTPGPQTPDGADAAIGSRWPLTGLVSDPAGLPAVDVEVCATNDRLGVSRCARTAADGSFVLELTEGNYLVVVTGAAGETAPARLVGVYEGRPALALGMTGARPPVAVATPPAVGPPSASPASITGRVTDDLGNAVPGVSVCAVSDVVERCVFTQLDGTYAIERLASGTYDIRMFDPLGRFESSCWGGCDAVRPVLLVAAHGRAGIDAVMR